MTELLEVTGVVAGYGDGPPILNGASLRVQPGKVHCIIGPNGAGKSTLLKAIVGMLKIREGDVKFKGESLKGLRPDQNSAQRHLLCSAGTRTFSQDDRPGKPAHGRLFDCRQIRP